MFFDIRVSEVFVLLEKGEISVLRAGNDVIFMYL